MKTHVDGPSEFDSSVAATACSSEGCMRPLSLLAVTYAIPTEPTT